MQADSTSTTRKPRAKKAAGPVQFEPCEINFNWSNDQWALAHLPNVRIAVVLMGRDRAGVREALDKMLASDTADGLDTLTRMVEGWINTRDHLKALVDLLDAATARTFNVLDEMPDIETRASAKVVPLRA